MNSDKPNPKHIKLMLDALEPFAKFNKLLLQYHREECTWDIFQKAAIKAEEVAREIHTSEYWSRVPNSPEEEIFLFFETPSTSGPKLGDLIRDDDEVEFSEIRRIVPYDDLKKSIDATLIAYNGFSKGLKEYL